MQFAATWMDLGVIIVNEVSQTGKYIIYMWNLKKNDTNELIYKTEIDPQTENKLMVTKGKGWGGIN